MMCLGVLFTQEWSRGLLWFTLVQDAYTQGLVHTWVGTLVTPEVPRFLVQPGVSSGGNRVWSWAQGTSRGGGDFNVGELNLKRCGTKFSVGPNKFVVNGVPPPPESSLYVDPESFSFRCRRDREGWEADRGPGRPADGTTLRTQEEDHGRVMTTQRRI